MVSTRNHPTELPPPPDFSARSTRGASATPSPRKGRKPAATTSAAAAPAVAAAAATHGGRRAPGTAPWAHTASRLTLLWLTVSLPLVAWDTLYVFLRPHSMPGGRWHRPVWSLYGIYAEVDHVYGAPAWRNGDGFTGAQSWMNVLESALYLAYLYVVAAHGKVVGAEVARAERSWLARSWWGAIHVVEGHCGALAALVGFATAVMTISKTSLYGKRSRVAVRSRMHAEDEAALNEACSGFHYIGHNDILTLIPYYIIPKYVSSLQLIEYHWLISNSGLWLVFPTYMVRTFGLELYNGLMMASGSAEASEPKQLAIKEE